ncbi:MAG TPA: GrpB family protein [Gemmatimonadales bacterium]
MRLVEYDERWPSLFRAEASRILAAAPELRLTLEHVGSTAVPGLCAKPVLDILAGHTAALPALACVSPLERARYEHRGDAGIVGHQFFRRGQPRAYHIHLVELGGRLWREYLAFRDYLRSDTRAAAEYADLKRQLAARYPRDREAYISGKSSFVVATIHRSLGTA